MLLLITGASGVGKSSARIAVAPAIAPQVESVELAHLVEPPDPPTAEWRQRTVGLAVQRAIVLQEEDRHLLLAGDPIALAEVLGAPGSQALGGVAALLLDADETAQTARLHGRDGTGRDLTHDVAFAAWMRSHITDPTYVLEAIDGSVFGGAWDGVEWDRVRSGDVPPWSGETLDTTDLDREAVAAYMLAWVRRVVGGPGTGAVPDQPLSPSRERGW